jgi:ATP-dependent Lon protease
VQERKRFSDEYEEEFSRDENRMFTTSMLVKNRTSNKKETNFTAPLIVMYNEPLLPLAASRLYSEEDVSDQDLMHEAIDKHFTLVACYPRYEEVEEPTIENIWEIALEMAFGREMDFDTSSRDYLDDIYTEARRRVRILKVYKQKGHFVADVEVVDNPARRTNEVKSQMRSAKASLARYASLPSPLDEKAIPIAEGIDHAGKLADFIGINTLLSPYDRLELLQEANDLVRLKMAHAKLVAQIRMLELDMQVITRIHEDFDKNQRDTVLREHISRLQMELNQGKSGDPDIFKLESQLETANLPKEVYETAEKELDRLCSAPPLSPEHRMISSYLHWLLDLPWSIAT